MITQFSPATQGHQPPAADRWQLEQLGYLSGQREAILAARKSGTIGGVQ
jgi:hypothetical protein